MLTLWPKSWYASVARPSTARTRPRSRRNSPQVPLIVPGLMRSATLSNRSWHSPLAPVARSASIAISSPRIA